MLLIDGHLDLSMNALEWNRDLTRPLDEVRRREVGKTDKLDRGKGVFSFTLGVERRSAKIHRGGIGGSCRAALDSHGVPVV